jgi:hypothetical protein
MRRRQPVPAAIIAVKVAKGARLNNQPMNGRERYRKNSTESVQSTPLVPSDPMVEGKS